MHRLPVARLAVALLGCVSCRGEEPRHLARTSAGAATSAQATIGAVRPAAGGQLSEPCLGSAAGQDCPDSAERAVLAALPGWSRPSAAERVYRPARGPELRLRDDSSEGFAAARYRLLGRLPATRYALVARTGWESQDYLLVGEAGDTVAVEGWPVVAPDGLRIAAASSDFEPCYQSNSVEIWRLEPRPPVREFRRETGDCTKNSGWGPSDVVWRDPQTVEFTVNRPVAESGVARPASRGRLARTGAGWSLTAAAR